MRHADCKSNYELEKAKKAETHYLLLLIIQIFSIMKLHTLLVDNRISVGILCLSFYKIIFLLIYLSSPLKQSYLFVKCSI